MNDSTIKTIQVWETLPADFDTSRQVSACYIEINGKMLVMERASISPEGKTWGVPAGKIEAGESPVQAALRELFEETAITISLSQINEIGKLHIRKHSIDYVYHMFQVHLESLPNIHLSEEHTKYIWASIPDIRQLPLVGGATESLNYYERMKRKGHYPEN